MCMYRLRFLLLILIMYDGNRIEFLIALQQQHTHSAMMISPISFSLFFFFLFRSTWWIKWRTVRVYTNDTLSLFSRSFSLSGDVVSGTDNHSLFALSLFFSVLYVGKYYSAREREKKDDLLRVIFSSFSLPRSEDKFVLNVER